MRGLGGLSVVGARKPGLRIRDMSYLLLFIFLAPRFVLTGSKLERHVFRVLVVNQTSLRQIFAKTLQEATYQYSIAACSTKVLLLANWPCGRCAMSPHLGSSTSLSSA
jgi:hypothetical protein